MNEESVRVPSLQEGWGAGKSDPCAPHGAWLGADKPAIVTLDLAAAGRERPWRAHLTHGDILPCLSPATPDQSISNSQ